MAKRNHTSGKMSFSVSTAKNMVTQGNTAHTLQDASAAEVTILPSVAANQTNHLLNVPCVRATIQQTTRDAALTRTFNASASLTHTIITFSTCHSDNTAHGGAAIIIRSSLQFTAAPSVDNDFLKAAIVNINLNHVPITVAAVYCFPKHKITPQQFDSFFNSLGHYFIVDGDLNAKTQTWGCHSTNPKGRSLFQSVTNNHLTILNPPNLTYWPASTGYRPGIFNIYSRLSMWNIQS
ncbi:hypothetical protein AGLY_016777 [Aphis glycines]|uniref:Endonuclease/exonuclease/phosphatase domain-containing protein n=1 Tax=Aphis glycines TaxID=307491 RepID=A0A6G0SXJ6_APHGL|nr:hypothetical protein AGLY_016777 [Aphis glycines]